MRIVAVGCAVPKNVGRADDYRETFGDQVVDSSIEGAGVQQWRYVSPDVCASDLCVAAAENALDKAGWERGSVELLIFTTTTPDYLMPANAPNIAHRLGLGENVFAIDLSAACSGYTDGLITSYSLIKSMGFRRAVLLTGYTTSRITDRTDKDSALLIGDAAAATLLERDQEVDCVVASTAGCQGSGAKIITQNVGYRHGLGWDANEITRKDMALFHNGMGVFGFTYSRVLKALRELIDQSGWTPEIADYFLLHQPHRYLLECLAEKANIPKEKLPIGLQRFGNTSGASIPMLMTTELGQELLEGEKRLVLLGFGAGLSWSGLCIRTHSPLVMPLLEV
ncbi:MAG: ketoacyl-ACP synthase III [Pirellulales bacterium]|nr:ketoacyl-ACP synthase III [Pirellulales bacterium]